MKTTRKITGGLAGLAMIAGLTLIPSITATAVPVQDNTCPAIGGVGTVHPAMTAPIPGDQNVSVYVGGSFTRVAGAELEGQLVVDGNASIINAGLYNMGRVGVGSGFLPLADSNLIQVGGDFTIASPASAEVRIVDAANNFVPGHIRVGGAATITGSLDLDSSSQINDNLGRIPALGTPAFAEWADNGAQMLNQIAASNLSVGTPGTAVLEWGTLAVNGDSASNRHIITVPASDLDGVVLDIQSTIDPTDVIVFRVTGSTANIDIQNVFKDGAAVPMGDDLFGTLTQRILWIVEDATSVTVEGGQVPGSFLVTNPSSTTTQAAAGTNGRIWVAGDLIHDRAGSEFHAYPFIGDVTMGCGEPPTPQDTDEPPLTVVTPQDPTFTESVCLDDGTSTTPSVNIPEDGDALTYSSTGTPGGNETVVVRVEAGEDYLLPETVPGWTVSTDRKSATYSYTFGPLADCGDDGDDDGDEEDPDLPGDPDDGDEENPDLPGGPDEGDEDGGTDEGTDDDSTTSDNDEGLPVTGSSVAPLAALGAGLMLAGVALVVRRRSVTQ